MDNIDDRAETIFQNAVQITTANARERYIRDTCGADAALEHRVRALLNVTAESTSTMESSAAAATTIDFVFDDSERAGSIIGPYELIQLIGVGGMGLVFLAQQTTPVQRQVALKIIRPGMDNRIGVRRFEAERQTLAHLNHPGIARLLDAGTTATGRPWFAMELAQGLPITDFCRQEALPLDARLHLFELVCDAIDHAHQQGVLHRDIKPANILVSAASGRYLPKIIDFGVARINPQEHKNHRTGNSPDSAQSESILGTPAYMSPEQTYMQDNELDARSDVYSLGILLYKLLTDSNPFQGIAWRDIDYLETRRLIHEVSPPVPSERTLAFAAAKDAKSALLTPEENTDVDGRQSLRTPLEWRRLAAKLKGDLDWITMKAIEKDRNRRYKSVGELTTDIARHLRHEPVEASPPSRIYRFKKLLRRRISRLVVLTLTLCIMLLLSLFLILGRMLLYEREESEKFRQSVRGGRQQIDAREDVIHNLNYATEMQTGFAAYFRGNVDRARASVHQFSSGVNAAQGVGFEWHYLKHLCSDAPNILTGDDGKVFSVAFSPDSTLLASSTWPESGSGSVQIRFGKTAALLQTIRGFDSDVNATCFNTDGTIILTSDDSGKICIWDTQTGDLKGQLDEFDNGVSQIFLASDDRTLIASEVDWGPLKSKTSVWDLKTQTRTLQIDQQRVLDVSEPIGIVATASNDGDISLRSFPELDMMTLFSGRHTATDCGCLSHDGKMLATGNKLGTVRIWHRDSPDSQLLFEPPPSAAAIRDMEFSSDDQQLFVAQSDGKVQVWNIATRFLQRVLNTGKGDAWSVDVSSDGQRIAVGYAHGRVELRDVASLSSLLKTVYRSPEPFRAVAHSEDGERMAIVDSVGATAALLSTDSAVILRTIPAPDGVEFRNVVFSADNQALWITDAVGTLFNANLETAEVVEQPPVLNHPVTVPVVSRDGRFLAFNSIQSTDKIATIWDIQSKTELFRIPAETPAVGSEQPSIQEFLDDKTVIQNSGGSLSQWSFLSGRKTLPEFLPQPYRVHHFSLSPDQKTLLVELTNSDVYFVDIASRKSIGMLQGLKEALAAVAFSLDGQTLATATVTGRIQLWHVSTRQSICALPRIDAEILSLWFTGDETRLYAAAQLESGEREIVVWDASGP